MKKILVFLLGVVLVLSSTAPLAAQEMDKMTTYKSENGYTATKISHPEDGVKEDDGIVDYNGVNDRGQNYSWSAVGYGDNVYVGTSFGAIYQTLKIIASQNNLSFAELKAGIDVLFNGTLYTGDEGEENTANRSLLVKINVKTCKTDIVVEPSNAGGYRAATKFKDKLYFAVADAQPYILQIDPKTDETKVVCRSEKPEDGSFISTGIRGLTVYQDELVAAMIGNNGAYLVASKNPDAGESSFEVIGNQQDFLDYPAYHYNDSIFGGAIWDIIEYNNKLYITVVTGKNGEKTAFALFSGTKDENDKWHYELIVGDPKDGAKYPFGLGSDRSGAANLAVYDGYLYIGGYNDPMIALPEALNMEFESIYRDLSSPVCLWRLDQNENIEMIAGDANEVFPEGPKGNMSAGFNSNMNQYVWRMQDYDGKLYVGTFDICSLAYPLMQFTNGDVFHMSEEEWQSQIAYLEKFLELIKNHGKDEAIATYDLNPQINEEKLIKDGNEMHQLMVAMNDLYVDSGNTRSAENRREEFYELLQQLIELYNKIKDDLPPELVEILDKVLNEENKENFGYFIETCKYLSKGERGFDLLVTEDGINFETITRDGFGDPYNHGLRVFAITDSGLCIGTANPFKGTQVWTLKEDDKEINQAELLSNKGQYSKNPQSPYHKVEIKINFNGDKLTALNCNDKKLIEGQDYYLTSESVVLDEKFLATLDQPEYQFTFEFASGIKQNYTLIILTDEVTEQPENKPTTPNNQQNNSSVATGDQVTIGLYIVGLGMALLGCYYYYKKFRHNIKK